MDYSYAYTILVLLIGIPWLLVYAKRPDLRREMLGIGIVVSLSALAEPLLYKNYWTPEFIYNLFNINIGFESILLMFFLGGLAAVGYEFLLKRELVKTPKDRQVSTMTKVILATVFVLLFVLTGFLGSQKINVIYYAMFAMLLVGLLILSFRNDLFNKAFISGLFMAVFGFLALLCFSFMFPGIIAEWWNLKAISGILVLRIPVESILWSFLVGFTLGPLYEMWRGFVGKS